MMINCEDKEGFNVIPSGMKLSTKLFPKKLRIKGRVLRGIKKTKEYPSKVKMKICLNVYFGMVQGCQLKHETNTKMTTAFILPRSAMVLATRAPALLKKIATSVYRSLPLKDGQTSPLSMGTQTAFRSMLWAPFQSPTESPMTAVSFMRDGDNNIHATSWIRLVFSAC